MIIKNRTWKSKQEVLDYLVDLFVTKNFKQNVDENSIPVYSHCPTGCAIGSLVKSSVATQMQSYADLFECYTFKDLIAHLENNFNYLGLNKIMKLYFKNIDIEFLQELQDLHDCNQLNFTGFQSIAQRFNLTISKKKKGTYEQ